MLSQSKIGLKQKQQIHYKQDLLLANILGCNRHLG